MKFNPKIIILGYYAGNDITDIGKKTIWLSTDENGNPTNITTTYTYVDEKGRYRRNYDVKTSGLFNKFNNFMSYWSHVYIFAKQFYIGSFLNEPEPTHVNSYPQDFLTKFDISKKMLIEINEILRQNDAVLVVMLIPSKVQVDDKAWKSYEKYFGGNSNRFNPQNEIIQFCSKKNIKCLDLLPDFIGKPELYFKIDGHWNEKGHEFAAEELYDYLVSKGLV